MYQYTIKCATIEIDMINMVSGFFVFLNLASLMLSVLLYVAPLTCISIKMVCFGSENIFSFM